MLGLGTKTAATLRRKMKYSEQGRIRMALGWTSAQGPGRASETDTHMLDLRAREAFWKSWSLNFVAKMQDLI